MSHIVKPAEQPRENFSQLLAAVENTALPMRRARSPHVSLFPPPVGPKHETPLQTASAVVIASQHRCHGCHDEAEADPLNSQQYSTRRRLLKRTSPVPTLGILKAQQRLPQETVGPQLFPAFEAAIIASIVSRRCTMVISNIEMICFREFKTAVPDPLFARTSMSNFVSLHQAPCGMQVWLSSLNACLQACCH